MKNTIYACLAALLIFCGCSSKSDNINSLVEYIPFQSCEDGRWGLISTDGEVLFADEFSERISMAINGRFFAKNDDDLWEIYTTDEKPQQVGSDVYKAIAPFTEDVTPAVKPGGHVILIDRDGEEVKVLDVIDGKKVKGVSRFCQGIAIFKNEDDAYGAINTSGEVVIPAEYCNISLPTEGKVLALEKKYEEELNNDDDTFDKAVVKVFDTSGSLIGEIPMKGVMNLKTDFMDGVVIVAKKYGSEKRYGLMDEKGEFVVAPSAKNHSIHSVQGEHFIFRDDDKCGLMDFEGNVVLRAKYSELTFAAEGLLCAQKEGDDVLRFIDFEGNPVGNAEFTSGYSFYGDGAYCLVRFDSNEYGFVSKDGERLKLDNNTELYDVMLNTGDDWVDSDFVDYAAYVASMNITGNSLDGISLGTSAQRAASMVGERKGETITAEDSRGDDELTYSKEHDYSNLYFTVYFDKDISAAITKTVYEDYYGYRFSREETTGYRFTDAKVDAIQIRINVLYDKLDGKLPELMKALKNKLTGLGRVIAERSDHTGIAVKTASGNVVMAFIERDSPNILYVGVGREDKVNLDNARGSMEGGDLSDDNWSDEDTVAVDSVAVDEVYADSVADY